MVQGVPTMDVDAILRRRPQVRLVDGLAYDNPEGSRRAKPSRAVDRAPLQPVAKALENFFKESNLTILRELALRQATQEIDGRQYEPDQAQVPQPAAALGGRRARRRGTG
jgi:K+-sensing histidine kinase KdpD